MRTRLSAPQLIQKTFSIMIYGVAEMPDDYIGGDTREAREMHVSMRQSNSLGATKGCVDVCDLFSRPETG